MTIEHDAKRKRFFTNAGDDEAYVSYEERNGALDLQHTIVPEDQEGEGIGSSLVKYALDYARENGKKVIATCPFVKAYIDRHEEYRDLV